MSIRILLCDDGELLRHAFRLVLQAHDDLTVVGEAADGLHAVEATLKLHPDVVLMDVQMPGIDGIEATRRITAAGSPARTLILTTYDIDDYVLSGLRAGASGFLLKDTTPARLVDAVRIIAAGDALLDPSVTRRLITQRLLADPPTPALPTPPTLSERETQVLTLIARGLSNTDIAQRLHLSDATVKTYVSRLFTRLDVRDRAQAVMLAYETGILTPGLRDPHTTTG